jgi:fumarylacetoacetate (FAA) hydrolase
MRFGDTIRIEMKGKDGQSIFGTIEQRVTGPNGAATPA